MKFGFNNQMYASISIANNDLNLLFHLQILYLNNILANF